MSNYNICIFNKNIINYVNSPTVISATVNSPTVTIPTYMNLTVIIPLVISPTVINTTVIRPKVNSPTNICRTVNVSSVISPIIYYIFVENTNVIITHIRSFDNFISLYI
jgi:hypothetical protein